MDKEIKERIAAINSGIIPEGYKKTKVGIVPVEWELSKMKKICEINRGGSPRPIEDYITDDNNGINWIKIGDTSVGGKYISSTKEKIKPEGARKSRQVFEGDFLLSNSMSYGRPYILKTSGCIHDGWLVISNYSDYFDLEFFYYLLCHHNIQRQYDMLSAGSGVQNLNKDLVAQVDVIIPPLPEQQKIAEILSTQDKLIELQEKKIEQLKELKKAYLQKMFPQKGSKYPELRFKGFTDPWEQCKLGKLIENGIIIEQSDGNHGELYPRAEEFTEKGIPYISASSISADGESIDFNLTKYLPIERAKQFRKGVAKNGDILLAHNATVGPAVLLSMNYEFAILSTSLTLYRLDDKKMNSYYFLQAIRSRFFQIQLETFMAQTTRNQVPILTQRNLLICYPTNINEQEKIGEFLLSFDKHLALHQYKLEQEKQKKKALMQLLLTGIVRTK